MKRWSVLAVALGLAASPQLAPAASTPESPFGQGFSMPVSLNRNASVAFENTGSPGGFAWYLPAAIHMNYQKNASASEKLAAPAWSNKESEEEFSISLSGMAQKLWQKIRLTPVGGFAMRAVEGSGVDEFYNFAARHFTFSPMLGFDVTRDFTFGGGVFTPEFYAVYRYETEENEDTPLQLNSLDQISLRKASANRVHSGLQAGVGVAFKFADNLQGRLSFDGDFQSGAPRHQTLFTMKYCW